MFYLSRLKTYVYLSLRDVFRLWSATQLQVIIISGICLPILILMGLKNGHVEELQASLTKDPNSRRLNISTPLGVQGDLLTNDEIRQIERQVKNVDIVIPVRSRNVTLRSTGDPSIAADVTIASTVDGDPELATHDVQVGPKDAMGLILTDSAANKLKLQVGDPVDAIIKRGSDATRESHEITFQVNGIIPGGEIIGYAHLHTMDNLRRFIAGLDISEWNIPAMDSRTAIDLYNTYLLICPKDDPLTEDDMLFFSDRYLQVHQINDAELLSLFGILNDSAAEEINIYKIQREDYQAGAWAPINEHPDYLAGQTGPTDDIILHWSEPLLLNIDGEPRRVIGLTLPTKRGNKRWFANTYIKNDAPYLAADDKTLNNPLQYIDPNNRSTKENVQISIDDNFDLTLKPRYANQPRSDPSPKNDSQPGELEGPSQPAETDIFEDIDETLNKDATPEEAEQETSPKVRESDSAFRFLNFLNGGTTNPDTTYFTVHTPDADRESAKESIEKEIRIESPQIENTIDPNAAIKGLFKNSVLPKDQNSENTDDIESQETPQPFFVPHHLLAYIRQYQDKKVGFDHQKKQFTQLPSNLGYTAAKIFVDTIYDVPPAFEILKPPRYSCESKLSEVVYIQKQDESLQKLVTVVAFGVFLFGVVTVFSVLVDSTDRKKGTIGILRVMGTSKLGVFFIVLMRAAVIGILAACVCILFGYGLAYILKADFSSTPYLAWKPVINVMVGGWEIIYVALGAVICAAFGAVIPAYRASRLDPFEAISQGQFN